MELVAAALFVPLMVVAVTQMVKMAVPQVTGWVTILVALCVGIVIALVDGLIGVTDISIASGIVAALEAIGVSTLAGKAGGGTAGDHTVVR